MKAKGIIPIIFSGLIVAALAVSYFLVLDTTAYPYEDKGLKSPEMSKKAYFSSFTNVVGDKLTSLKFSQDDLNQFALNKKNETEGQDVPAGDLVNNFYVEIDKNQFNFFIEANLKVVKTRIKMETTLEEQDNQYVFNITSLKLGNFPGFVLTTFGLLDKIDLSAMFQRMNLSITYDKVNSRLVYTKENVKKDYLNHMKLSIKEPTGLMASLLYHSDLSFLGNNGIAYTHDFSNLISNDSLVDSSMENDHYKYYSDVQSSINNAFTYMKSDVVVDDVIETYLSSMSYHFDAATNLDLLLEDSLKTTPVADYYEPHVDKEIASIDEMSLTNILRGSDAIETYQAFPNSDNPILLVVDNFYVDIFTSGSSSFMNYTICINVNGLETRAIVQSRLTEKGDNDYQMKFNVQDVYYGNKLADAEMKALVMGLFEKGMDKLCYTEYAASYDKETKSVNFDFAAAIKHYDTLDAYESALYDQVGTRSISVSNSKINEVGSISLRFKKA